MKEPQYKPITGMINVNDIQEIMETNKRVEQENIKLNNIINELEMFINERIAILKEEQQEFKEDIPLSNWEEQQSYRNEILIRTNEIIQLEDTLDKLNELKGDSSNE